MRFSGPSILFGYLTNVLKSLVRVFFPFSVLLPLNLFAQSTEPWEIIFNGENFDGWSVIERPANVTIEDRSLVMHMTTNTSRHAFVRTNKKYKDFIFEVEFKRDRTMDSGILFRAESAPDTAFSALFGYMVKVDPSLTRLWTGGLFLDYGNGINWLHPLERDDRARHAEKTDGEWNLLRVEAIDNNIRVWLNGIPTVHLIDDKYAEGYIAFKIHYLMNEVEQEKLEIAFRNIRIITQNLKMYTHSMDFPAQDTRGKVEITYFR